MKILSAQQTRDADLATIQNEPVTSVDLMERAAKACTGHLLQLIKDSTTTIHVVCGKGNNGGDGLAIARLLNDAFLSQTKQKNIHVHIIEHSDKESADFSINKKRLEESAKNISVLKVDENNFENFSEQLSQNKFQSIIIDAILGNGINKEVTGIAAQVIDGINKSGIPVISIDVPSGLFPDEPTKGKNKAIIRASLTLTFNHPKFAFMMAENAAWCGEFVVIDIGLDPKFIEKTDSNHHYIQKKDVTPLLLSRKKFSHKGDYGHSLLIAGSLGKMGAAVMAAKACLRCGTGLLTIHVPKCGVEIMQVAIPEAMVSVDSNKEFIESLPQTGNFSAAGIGPGLGTDHQTGNVLKLLIQNFAGPIVIDADALNLLSENKTWLAFLKPHTILTPHPKEFDRIAGAHTSDFDRLQSAKELASKHTIIIILKGAHTAIVTPSRNVYFNSTGNPGMAKGGSGDVLTGMLTGLLARGYNPFNAALLGVYLHGLAGDLALAQYGEESFLATEITSSIPAACSALHKD